VAFITFSFQVLSYRSKFENLEKMKGGRKKKEKGRREGREEERRKDRASV